MAWRGEAGEMIIFARHCIWDGVYGDPRGSWSEATVGCGATKNVGI